MCPGTERPTPPDAVVVVACDGRPDGDAALLYAADRADERQARLLVVAPYEGPDGRAGARAEADRRRLARRRAERAIERALAEHSGGQGAAAPRVVTAPGPATRSILTHCADAVLIVVALHDRGLVQELFQELAHASDTRRCGIPIALVPGEYHLDEPDQQWPYAPDQQWSYEPEPEWS